MIKIANTGELEIHLKGKTPASTFWKMQLVWLFVNAVLVWLAFTFLSTILAMVVVAFSLLGLGLLYFFQKNNVISAGVLTVSAGQLSYHVPNQAIQTVQHHGENANIKTKDGSYLLTLMRDNATPLVFSGFEYQREAEVMLQCLQGKPVQVRKKEIKMQKQTT